MMSAEEAVLHCGPLRDHCVYWNRSDLTLTIHFWLLGAVAADTAHTRVLIDVVTGLWAALLLSLLRKQRLWGHLWCDSRVFNESRDGGFFSTPSALAYPTVTCSFGQTVWHGGLHQVFGWARWRGKMTNTNTPAVHRSPSFTDPVGTDFPLWHNSLAAELRVCVTVSFFFFVSVLCLILPHDRICQRAQPSLVFCSSCLIHAVACSSAADRAGTVWL